MKYFNGWMLIWGWLRQINSFFRIGSEWVFLNINKEVNIYSIYILASNLQPSCVSLATVQALLKSKQIKASTSFTWVIEKYNFSSRSKSTHVVFVSFFPFFFFQYTLLHVSRENNQSLSVDPQPHSELTNKWTCTVRDW